MERPALPLSPSISMWTHDVFLNFRGEDSRYGFTGNLYNALRKRGINTFMDDGQIQKGVEISPFLLKAIEESRIAIIVFSQNYASSKWCLEELVKIIACMKSHGLLAYPIFYKVDPRVVRQQIGSYGEELAKHEEKLKHDKEKVNNWRLALHEAANLAGWHFRDRYEYEYEFIKQIIKEVSRELGPELLYVADYPVGLASRVLQVTSLLVLSDSSVDMVGICGIGGIGKSTLARDVYNLIGNQFESKCFVADVRENSTKHGLVHLQETILSDILGEKNIKLGDVHKGIPILLKQLHRKKVLLILDDVDRLEQLRKLAGSCKWFGLGSRIIITTRYKHLLLAHGVENIYDVPTLSHYEALDLLNWHAFDRRKPDACYKAVLNRAISYAHGLPLALNIIGADLFGKTTDEWESALDRYEKIPHEEVLNTLKVSFDSLNECEKQIFLDIACFFIGESLVYVEGILNACGFHPKYGIGVLIDKALISITEERLWMHDLIQDMGREIVRHESALHPGKRSRLWYYEDVLQVLKENTGTDNIEVIILDNLSQRKEMVQWNGKAFKKMKCLRILIIRNACFSRGPRYLPNSLRVLEWSEYPAGSLPPDFHPTKLVKLKLPGSCLILVKPFKNLDCLTSMDFTDNKSLTEVPNLSGLPNLRTLYLDNCVNLISVHDSVGFLGKLEELSASGCTNLRTIPGAIKSTSLRILALSECPRLVRFPEILEKMENILCINLWQTAIEELPFSVGNLVGLESLTLMECNRLKKLPSSIFTLPRLSEIQADSCRGFEIFDEYEGNGQLKSTVSASRISLYLGSCNLPYEDLVLCLSGFANMVHLDLSYSDILILPACIKECIHLRTLLLENCKQLQDISGIPPKLLEIDALNCTSLTSQSASILLNQAFHENRGKNVILPGSKIPKWLDHSSRERSVTFWARNSFPAGIALCIAFGMLEKPPHSFRVRVCVLINGCQWMVSRFCYSWSILTDHVWLCDLSGLLWDGNLIFEHHLQDWNHVEVLCMDDPIECFTVEAEDGPTRKAVVQSYGIHVFRKETTMEDILFTNVNPALDKNDNFKRVSKDSYLTAQSRYSGTIYDGYYCEDDNGLELSSYSLNESKRQRIC